MASNLPLYYAQRAREYERIYEKAERQDELRRLRAFVGSHFQAKDVLELACGTGYWTEVLSRSAASVTAVDINEAVLAIAHAKPLGSAKVAFQRADIYDLPDFHTAFSAGLAAFWWSHVPLHRLPLFLQGFHKALAPGATVVFVDNRYVEGSSTPISRTDAEGNTYQKRRLQDGAEHEILKNFPGAEDLQSAVAPYARDISIQLLQYYWILTYFLR